MQRMLVKRGTQREDGGGKGGPRIIRRVYIYGWMFNEGGAGQYIVTMGANTITIEAEANVATSKL